jgi:hypothetical protein
MYVGGFLQRSISHEMTTRFNLPSEDLGKTETPEEREHARHHQQIEARKLRAAELQADIETVKLALSRFEAEHHPRVGTLFPDLDDGNLASDEYERRISMLHARPELPMIADILAHALRAEQTDCSLCARTKLA